MTSRSPSPSNNNNNRDVIMKTKVKPNGTDKDKDGKKKKNGEEDDGGGRGGGGGEGGGGDGGEIRREGVMVVEDREKVCNNSRIMIDNNRDGGNGGGGGGGGGGMNQRYGVGGGDERGRRGDGGNGGEDGRRSSGGDVSIYSRGGVCCRDGRVWIFLVLGVLTLVFSAVLVGVYMNVRSLTSSLEHLEVLPSFVPAAVGAVAALSVLMLFCKRSKPLVYLMLLMCFSAALFCVITAVLTSTRVLEPLQSARNCVYTSTTRVCQCTIDGEIQGSSVSSKTKDSSTLLMNDVAGCSVVTDILPNMMFTMVGIYGVIALVCCINGVIAILVCRMEHNRKEMQSLEYTDDYIDTPSSSNSESLLVEQQNMLPSSQQEQLQLQYLQQQIQQQQQQLQLQQLQQQLQQQREREKSPLGNIQLTTNQPTPATSPTTVSTTGAILADIYTNTKAIEDCNNEDSSEVAPSSDVTYSPSDAPIGYNEACRMRRSRSFSQPSRATAHRGSSPNSSTSSSGSPTPFFSTDNASRSTTHLATNCENGNGSKLAPRRKRNRRAVTLHGLDRDQLMLILNLQMRYLQESDHDSKKPENFALNLTNNSTTDILMKTAEGKTNSADDESMDTTITTNADVTNQREEEQEDLDMKYDVMDEMKQVISSNLSINGRAQSMRCVGTGSKYGQYGLDNTNMAHDIHNNGIHPNEVETVMSSAGGGMGIPFQQLQKRSMTPTPRQERLSSARTSEDEWDFKPARLVRSHTPQPYHFKNNRREDPYAYNNYNGDFFQQHPPQPFQLQQQQRELTQQQRQQYIMQLQQQQQKQHQQQQQHHHQQQKQEQYWTLQQLQQRQLQELEYQNMQQQVQEQLFLQQQASMISQQQNILLQQQREEEEQQLQQQQHLEQQLEQERQHQQHINERYQQLVQEHRLKQPINPNYSNNAISSPIPRQMENNDDYNNDDDDDDEPTRITIDLRDVTKTGPLIYENVPPPRKLSQQSSIANSNSSLASSFRGVSASPQPKSILHNRVQPQGSAHSVSHFSSNPPITNSMMTRQLSQSSNLSSCSGSINLEIQRALEGASSNVVPMSKIEEKRDNSDNGKSEGALISITTKSKKKLSKKEKKELKEKEKELKEKEKEREKEKKKENKEKNVEEKDNSTAVVISNDQKRTGLARSDSDVRKSGVIPDRWQTIMSNGADNGAQTLWENVQKKITSEAELESENPHVQQTQTVQPVGFQPPVALSSSISSSSSSSSSSPYHNARNNNNKNNTMPSPHQHQGYLHPPHHHPNNLDPRLVQKRSDFHETNANIIFPLTYDTTKSPQPQNPTNINRSQSNPNPNANHHRSVHPNPNINRPRQHVPETSNQNASFIPIPSKSTNNYEDIDDVSQTPSPNKPITTDPAAPPKPPRLHGRKQQEPSSQDNKLGSLSSPQNLRPKSYVNAVDGEIKTDNSQMNNSVLHPQGNNTNASSIINPHRGNQTPTNKVHPSAHQNMPSGFMDQKDVCFDPTMSPSSQSSHQQLQPAGQNAAASSSRIYLHNGDIYSQPVKSQHNSTTNNKLASYPVTAPTKGGNSHPFQPRVYNSLNTAQPIPNQLPHQKKSTAPPPPPPPSSSTTLDAAAYHHKTQSSTDSTGSSLYNQQNHAHSRSSRPAPIIQPLPNSIPALAICDTDLDDLPSPNQQSSNRLPMRCQSLSPPPYAPPPLYKSMECIAIRQRSTSSSSSEAPNTSCTFSEPHNASFASSERSCTPPIQHDFQRGGRGQQSLNLPRDHGRWRQGQRQENHSYGRQLSLGERGQNGYANNSPRQQQLPTRQAIFQNNARYNSKNNNTGNNNNNNNNDLLNSSSSSSSTTSSNYPQPQQHKHRPHHPHQQQQHHHQQQQQPQDEPYLLMRRCQSMEDHNQIGLNRTGWVNSSGKFCHTVGQHNKNNNTDMGENSTHGSDNSSYFNINNKNTYQQSNLPPVSITNNKYNSRHPHNNKDSNNSNDQEQSDIPVYQGSPGRREIPMNPAISSSPSLPQKSASNKNPNKPPAVMPRPPKSQLHLHQHHHHHQQQQQQLHQAPLPPRQQPIGQGQSPPSSDGECFVSSNNSWIIKTNNSTTQNGGFCKETGQGRQLPLPNSHMNGYTSNLPSQQMSVVTLNEEDSCTSDYAETVI